MIRFSKIIPSFFVDKASCTRQFESELSLHSLASLFPIKEGSTFLTKPLFNSLYAPFGSPSSGGQKPQEREDVTALRCSEPLCFMVGGASKPCAILCGMGPPSCYGSIVSIDEIEVFYKFSTRNLI